MKRLAVPLILLAAVAAPLALTGCGKTVERVDVRSDINLSGNWNDADAKQTADVLLASCLKSPWAEEFQKAKGKKPTVKVGRVVVRTNGDTVNTQIFTNSVADALVNSGKAVVLGDSSDAEAIRAERAEQEKNASESTRKESFQEIGADFLMLGEINVQDDQDGGKKVKFYQISLRLNDVTTNLRVWSDKHELKKYVER